MNVLALIVTLATVAAEILVGFVLWRLILWNSYAQVGWRPLALAYLASAAALFLSSLIPAIGSGVAYPLFLFSIFINDAMAWIGLVGVPLAAFLVRKDRLSFGVAIASVVVAPFAVATLISIKDFGPTNFLQAVADFSLVVVPTTGAFFITLIATIRRKQRVSAVAPS